MNALSSHYFGKWLANAVFCGIRIAKLEFRDPREFIVLFCYFVWWSGLAGTALIGMGIDFPTE